MKTAAKPAPSVRRRFPGHFADRTMRLSRSRNRSFNLLQITLIQKWLLGAVVLLAGCGTTKNHVATEQMLISDAVDRAIAKIDFKPLAGQSVYFDTKYITDYKSIGFVNSNYVISGLRQQLLAAGCRLQDKEEDAEYIVEARMGTLGNDEHEIVYGLPANNALASAASVVPNAPPMPAIPEISIARKNDQMGAAKIAAFAYHRATRLPVWQSGLSIARSTSKDIWLLGAGPFERGTIYEDVQFAGSRLRLPFLSRQRTTRTGPVAAYAAETIFHRPGDPLEPDLNELIDDQSKVQQASGDEAK